MEKRYCTLCERNRLLKFFHGTSRSCTKCKQILQRAREQDQEREEKKRGTRYDYVIYQIEFPDKKRYVGYSNKEPQVRLKEHLKLNNTTVGPYCLTNKFAEDQLILSILSKHESRFDAMAIEAFLILTSTDTINKGFSLKRESFAVFRSLLNTLD